MITKNKMIGGGRKTHAFFESEVKREKEKFDEAKANSSKTRKAARERADEYLTRIKKGGDKAAIKAAESEVSAELESIEADLIAEDAEFDAPENPYFTEKEWDAFDAMGIRPANGVEVDL